MNFNKLYVVLKKIAPRDDFDNCYENCECEVLAVCNNPKRALKILEDELAHCKAKRIEKNSCLLYVKIFDNINQVSKKKEKIMNIFQFKRVLEII